MSREAFEKWWNSMLYSPGLLQREADGYKHGATQVAYFAWQSALQWQAGQGEAVAYGLLGAFSKKWDGYTIVKAGDADLYDAAALLPLYTHPPAQAAQPQVREMGMNAWYSTEQVQEMIDFLRRSANADDGLDVGDYWAMCDEAADMIESMLHYEQSHGLRRITASQEQENQP